MRILHTSDWHLGATSAEASRYEDNLNFLTWLEGEIRTRSIEVLILAGDVFDQCNPGAEALGLYYRFLHGLMETEIRQIVVVGGNHDSGARLDAPRDLLAHFRVHVTGGLDSFQQGLERCLCPITGSNGTVEAVVISVPFVHEWRLGFRSSEDADLVANQTALGDPFRELYRQLADKAEAEWPGVPLVATGHLACVGSLPDDAPQEIHLIGSLGGLPISIFDPRFAYVALGHIHRAYRVGGTSAWYSGSPIALNVKEGKRDRHVNLVDLNCDGTVRVEQLPIPNTRQVLEFVGSPDNVKESLKALTWSEPLPPMVSVELQVQAQQIGLEQEFRTFVAELKPPPILIGLFQTTLKTPAEGEETPGVRKILPRLQDLTPKDLFKLLCKAKDAESDDLLAAFDELVGPEVDR